MQIIVHRVNTIEILKTIPSHYGVEIDIREDLTLSHDPSRKVNEQQLDSLENYLKEYVRSGHQGTIVFNIKAAGIEDEVIKLAAENKIENYFLLDVEMPYLYRASGKGFRKIAVRYSEYEPIELTENFRGKVDWVWIDTATKLPLDEDIVKKLQGFKTCLVCPERWGRPEDISVYRKTMKELSFSPTAVMTALATATEWEK